jgi:hypothetical protein
MIDLGACSEHCLNGRVTRSGARVQIARLGNLLPDIRRRIQNKPAFAIS